MYKSPQFKSNKLELTVSRPYVPLCANYFFQSYSNPEYFKKFYKINFFTRLLAINADFYYGLEAKDFGYVLFGQAAKYGSHSKIKKKNLKGILHIFDRTYKFGDSLLEFTLQVKKTDFSEYSKKQLLEVFGKFSKDYVVFCTALLGMNMQYVVEDGLREFLRSDKNAEEELAILTFPDKQNVLVQELMDLLRLRIKLEKVGVKNLEKCKTKELGLLKKHVDKYGWINARGAINEGWTVKEVFDRAMAEKNCAKRLVEIVKNQKEHQKQVRDIFKTKKPNAEIRDLIKIAKELVYFRTYRTDYLNWMFFNIRPLLNALAGKMGISFEDIIYYLPKEIMTKKKVSEKEVVRRKEGYAILLAKPYEVLFSSDPKKILEWKKKHTEVLGGNVTEVKGMSAYKGIVRGKAVLVLKKADMVKVKSGDVLITFMTTPDMVSVMQKAIAFVTDEGGITCHAAIVAREMKRPCVTGTKIATKVFKDGDEVEVDANTGVVKIIK